MFAHSLGEFKEVIGSMVLADGRELLVGNCMLAICTEDLSSLQKSKGSMMVRNLSYIFLLFYAYSAL